MTDLIKILEINVKDLNLRHSLIELVKVCIFNIVDNFKFFS